MRDTPERVVVAGAGPVGLVLALSLAQRGHPVTVLEKLVDPLQQVRRAGTLHAATLEMLDDIGLYERLEPRGLIAPLVHYWDRAQPDPVAVFDHGVLVDDVRFPHALQCDRLKVIEESLKMAAGLELVDVRTGSEMVRFSDHTADGVTVWFDTADGERRCLRADYLVSCEGAHSVTRKQLGINFEGFAFPDRTMTLSVNFDFSCARGYGLRNYILDPVEWLNLFKWPDVWRVVLGSDPSGEPDDLLDDRVIESRLQGFHATGVKYEVVAKSLYTVHQRVAETFRVGRVLLAGDAAHVNSPIGAMGMNSGIHDAVNLAEKLHQVLRRTAGEEALDRYVRQRRHVAVAHVQATTIRNKKLMAESDPQVRRRNLAELRSAASDPGLARQFLLRSSLVQSVREAAEIS